MLEVVHQRSFKAIAVISSVLLKFYPLHSFSWNVMVMPFQEVFHHLTVAPCYRFRD